MNALLLYAHPLGENAPTIMEHVRSFGKYSKYSVLELNTEFGFPRFLSSQRFAIIILHYSLFGSYPFCLSKKFITFLREHDSAVKVAFFQDEYQFVPQRHAVINSVRVDLLYTLLNPTYHDEVYYKHTAVKKVFRTLTGYVDEELIKMATVVAKPFADRQIDVGYRARHLPFWMGKGSQEKTEIADGFIENARGAGLHLDIKTAEGDRIYGHKWHEFVADCKAMIGVEAGVSVFDIEDKIRPAVVAYLEHNPDASFREVQTLFFAPLEDRLVYRTISPRIFEMAALRVVMILFEGEYQGIIEPNVHYIPLKKDLSNFGSVVEQFRNEDLVKRLTDNVFDDLIASGAYSYKKFIAEFDAQVTPYVSDAAEPADDILALRAAVDRFSKRRAFLLSLKAPLHRKWPGKSFLKRVLVSTGILERV